MAYYLTINAVHLWKKCTRKNCTDRSIWKLIVVLFSSSRSVVTKTDVSSVGIRLCQSNSDSKRLTPTVRSILSFIDEHGIQGMLGCLDCMHVVWKNCPVALQGAFTGKEGTPTIVLEAMSDYHLWIWHAAFGFAGALNDLNIWENSSLLQLMLDGTMATLDFDFGLVTGFSKKCFFWWMAFILRQPGLWKWSQFLQGMCKKDFLPGKRLVGKISNIHLERCNGNFNSFSSIWEVGWEVY